MPAQLCNLPITFPATQDLAAYIQGTRAQMSNLGSDCVENYQVEQECCEKACKKLRKVILETEVALQRWDH